MPGAEKKERTNQPIHPWGYLLLSAFCLCLALLVGCDTIFHFPEIRSGGVIHQIYYVLLLLHGLGTAAFLFRAMKSTATITGR